MTKKSKSNEIHERGSVLMAAIICLSLLMAFMAIQARTMFLTLQLIKHHADHVQAQLLAQDVHDYLIHHPETNEQTLSWKIQDPDSNKHGIVKQGTISLTPDVQSEKSLIINVTWNELSTKPVNTSINYLAP